MLKVAINGQAHLEAAIEKGKPLINGNLLDWDLVKIDENRFHALVSHQSFDIEVISANRAEKLFQLKINGQIFDLRVQDRFDLLLEKLGMSNANASKVNDLKAPMPGLVLNILVKAGDAVKKGEKLIILEAMKMENILKAPADVTVKEVKAIKGSNVNKNQVLIVFG